MLSSEEANNLLTLAWPAIVDECRAVLGGELHYQAVVYHCLRLAGVPRTQIGMNVKQWISDPTSQLFKSYDLRKHENFRGGFEPIPDIVLFQPEIGADWRRRNFLMTLQHMVMAIEIKASERAGGRLGAREIVSDIYKLAAHRDEVASRGVAMSPVMVVIDTAPIESERMRTAVVDQASDTAREHEVRFMYVSQSREININPPRLSPGGSYP